MDSRNTLGSRCLCHTTKSWEASVSWHPLPWLSVYLVLRHFASLRICALGGYSIYLDCFFHGNAQVLLQTGMLLWNPGAPCRSSFGGTVASLGVTPPFWFPSGHRIQRLLKVHPFVTRNQECCGREGKGKQRSQKYYRIWVSNLKLWLTCTNPTLPINFMSTANYFNFNFKAVTDFCPLLAIIKGL